MGRKQRGWEGCNIFICSAFVDYYDEYDIVRIVRSSLLNLYVFRIVSRHHYTTFINLYHHVHECHFGRNRRLHKI